jgi:hypothetical protein
MNGEGINIVKKNKMKTKFLPISLVLTLISCNNSEKSTGKNSLSDKDDKFSICSDDCKAKNKKSDLSCKLTTPELQKRKSTVLESLRKQVLETKELNDGYAFKFPGTDKMIDELIEFIKTERECCDFFTFNLSVSGDKTGVWMGISGPEGAKDFIKTELEL